MRKLLSRIGTCLASICLCMMPDIACAVPTISVTPTVTGGLVNEFIRFHIIGQALIAFWGIAAVALFYYASKMVYEAQKDGVFTDMGNAIVNALTGFAIIACAAVFADSFGQAGLSTDNALDVSPGLIAGSLNSIRTFIISLTSAIFVLLIVLVALRMISSKGEQGDFDKWKKVLVDSCIGVVIMLIADVVVQAIADRDAFLIIAELKGIALFLLTFTGFLCVIALVLAGIFLIVSIDEGLKDRAKKIVTGTLISLVIVLISHAVIRTFI